MCLRFEQITLNKRDPDPVQPSGGPTESLPDPEIELITPIPPDPAPEGEVYRVWRSDYSDLVKAHSEWIACPTGIPQGDKTVYKVDTKRTDKGKSIPVTIYVYDVGGDSEGEVAGHQQCLEFVNWDEFVTITSSKCTIDNNESSVYKLKVAQANTTIFSNSALMGQYNDGMASAYKPTNDKSCGKTTVWFVNDKNKSQKITFSVTATLKGGLNTTKLTKTFNYTIDWTPWTAKAVNLTAMYTYTQTPDSAKDYYSTGAGWEKVVAELGLKDPVGQINNITMWKNTFSDKGLKELHDSVGYNFGVIEGCANPDAAITSKVAGGDLVLVRAYGTAFEASGLADNQLFDIVKESKTEGEEDPKKDGTEDNRSGILVRVLKAKNLDKAKVWDGYAKDKHNGFIEKLQKNFSVVYQPLQYNLQSWNLASGKTTIMAVIVVFSVISIAFKMLISEIYCVFDPDERIQCDRAPKASAGLFMPLFILISIWYALPF